MPKIIDIDLIQLEAIATKGYSISMICSSFGISRSYVYSNKHIKDTIKRGLDIAKQNVINDLFARSSSDDSATSTIFLAKQLRVFEDYYPTSTPKSIAEALTKISNIYKSVDNGELATDKADKLIHYLEVYIKTYEITEIEKRLELLEDMANVKE